MNYRIAKLYESILAKLTKPGLTVLLLITGITVTYVGIPEFLGIHALVALTFYPPVPVITIFVIGIVLVEGVYEHTYMPFIICRRRLDVPNAPWESFETFILDYDEDESEDFFDYQNDFYSNDGFCPRSFAEMDTPYEVVLGERWKSIAQITEFFQFVLPRMGHQFNKTYMQSLTFPTIRDTKELRSIYGNKDYLLFRLKFWYGAPLIDRAPKSEDVFLDKMYDAFKGPEYLKSPFNIDPYEDFQELGVSLVSGSAEDSSSYIYEVEQPQFFPYESIRQLADLYDPEGPKLTVRRRQSDYFGIKNMGTFMENMTIPEVYSYNNNYELLEEYPVNIGAFFMKREWEETPDALTFRDPFVGNYANLTRFTSSSFRIDPIAFRQEFFLMHKAPRSVKPKVYDVTGTPNIEFLNKDKNITKSNHITVSRFLAPEFTRFGWFSYLQSLIEKGLRYYVALDKDRSYRMYSGFPGELEMLPTGFIFNHFTKLFNPKKALLKKLCTHIILLGKLKANGLSMFFFTVTSATLVLFSYLVRYIDKIIVYFFGRKYSISGINQVINVQQWNILKTNNNNVHTENQVSTLI